MRCQSILIAQCVALVTRAYADAQPASPGKIGNYIANAIALTKASESKAATAPPPSAIVTIGGQTLTAFDFGSEVSVGGQVVTMSHPPKNIFGQLVKAGPSGLVVGYGDAVTTMAIPATTPPPSAVVTIGGQTLTAINFGSEVSVGGQVVTMGHPPKNIFGELVKAGPSGLVVGHGDAESTLAIPAATSPPAALVTIGGRVLPAMNWTPDWSPRNP